MRQTHLLGIGYKHIKGGEDSFLRSSRRVVDSGREAASQVRQVEGANAAAQRSFSQYVRPVQAAVGALTAATAAISAYVAITASAVTMSARYEAGLVGVGKTADIQGAELALLGEQIDAVSRRIPAATDRLLEIGQAAGQLGVQGSDNIVRFTETVAKLDSASDLGGEEAATALARILNVTGESVSTVDVLASVIVSLGNSFAATESQIAHHAGEVARATAVYEIGSAEAAALGTTLAAFGVRAELSGSAVGRAFRVIESAVKTGGEEMAALAAVSRSSADEIAAAWGESPVQAFNLFLRGLREAQGEGANVAQELDSVGLKGEEVLKVLPVLAKEFSTLARAQRLAREETQQATALEEEAARANATLTAQYQILQNSVSSWIRLVGGEMVPEVTRAVQQTQEWIEDNRDLASQLGDLAAGVLKAAAAAVRALAENVDLVVSALSGMAAAWASFKALQAGAYVLDLVQTWVRFNSTMSAGQLIMAEMSGAVKALSGAFRGLTAAMAANPLGVLAVVLGGLVALLVAAHRHTRELREEEERFNQVAAFGSEAIADQTRAHREILSSLQDETLTREELSDLVQQMHSRQDEFYRAEAALLKEQEALLSDLAAQYRTAAAERERLFSSGASQSIAGGAQVARLDTDLARLQGRMETVQDEAQETRDRLRDLWDQDQMDRMMSEFVAGLEEVADRERAAADAGREQAEAFRELIAEYELGVAGAERVARAYLDGQEAGEAMVRQLEMEAEIRERTKGLTRDQAAAVREMVEAQYAAEDAMSAAADEAERLAREQDRAADASRRLAEQQQAAADAEIGPPITEQVRLRQDLEASAQRLTAEVERRALVEQEAADVAARYGLTTEQTKDLMESVVSDTRDARSEGDRAVDTWSDWAGAGRAVLDSVGALSPELAGVLDLVQQVLSAYQQIAATDATINVSGQAGQTGDATGAMSSFASGATAYLAIVAAAYSYADAYIEKKRAERVQGSLHMGGDYRDSVMSSVDRINEALQGAWTSLDDSFREFQNQTGATIDRLAQIEIDVTGTGEITARVTDFMGREFEHAATSMQDAVDWAYTMALRASEISGLSEEMRQLLEGAARQGVSIDEFNRAVEILSDVESRGLSPIARSARELINNAADVSRLFEEIGISMGGFLDQNLEEWRRLGEQALGIQRSAHQEQLDDIRGYNAELTRERERVTRQIEDLMSQLTEALVGKGSDDLQKAIQFGNRQVRKGLQESAGHFFDTFEQVIEERFAQSGNRVNRALVESLEDQITDLQKYLDGLADLDLDPADARGRGGGGRRHRRESLEATLVDLERQALPDFERQMLEVRDRFAELREEGGKLGFELERINELERQQIALLKQQTVGDLIDEYAPGGNRFADQLAEVQERFEEARRANEALSASERELARDRRLLAEAEAEARRQLAESVADSFGLPMTRARQEVARMRDAIEFLSGELREGSFTADQMAEFMAQLGARAQGELLGIAEGILNTMGATEQAAEVRASLQEAQFHLEVARLNFLYHEYLALGLLTKEVSDQLEGLLGFINDPANWPDFDVIIPPPPAPPSVPTTTTGPDDDERRRQEILDQIAAWQALAEPENTRRLRELHEVYEGMIADVQRLGISMEDFNAAFQVAVEDYWDEVLGPYEDQDLATVQGNLAEINSMFDDLVAAAHQYGGDLERIEAARRRAIQDFWDDALSGLQDYRDALLGGSAGGVSPEGQLSAAQARFDQVSAAALGGDLEAIQQLPGVIDALLSQARSYYGTGPAYQALLAAVTGVMDQLLAQGFGGAIGPHAVDSPESSRSLPPITLPPVGALSAPIEGEDPVAGLASSLERDLSERRRSGDEREARIERLMERIEDQSQQIEDLTRRVDDLVELLSDQAASA